MFIPDFWVGVIFTILAELGLSIFVIVLACRNTKVPKEQNDIDNTQNY